jgi:hypothetical protein
MSKREQLLVAPLPPDAQAAFKSSAAERAERFQNAVDTNVLRNELEAKKTGIIQAKVSKVEAKYRAIRSEIDDLEDKRQELLCSPRSREEMRELANKVFDEGRHMAMKLLLQDHLKACQAGRQDPFNMSTIKVSLIPESKVWMLYFLCMSHLDIAEACQALPDIGKPQAVIDREVAAINKRIADLAAELDAL